MPSLRLRLSGRPLVRGSDALQIGLDPDTAVLVDGLTRAEIGFLSALGSSYDEAALRRIARSHQVDDDRYDRLVALLHGAGSLVVPPATRRRRTPARRGYVVVDGPGRLAEAIADVLRTSFLDVRRGAGVAARLDADLDARVDLAPPGAVVLVAEGAVAQERGRRWWKRRVPVLPVVATERHVQVGPVVTPPGPCLLCLDLHRTDRDPGWPHILAQLTTRPARVDLDPAGAALVAGVVCHVLAGQLAGTGRPPGLAWDVDVVDPALARRRWAPHPRCSCSRSRTWDDDGEWTA